MFLIAEDLSNFFTKAEKQKLIFKEIENIRAGEMDLHIPGYENVKLYPGKSISKCVCVCVRMRVCMCVCVRVCVCTWRLPLYIVFVALCAKLNKVYPNFAVDNQIILS